MDIFEALMNKEKFLRKASLMRNPEGSGENKRCPVCKKPIRISDMGDMTCENYELRENYENTDKCFWHRWKDGINYWSDPMEMFTAFAKESPEFKEYFDKVRQDQGR